MRSSTRSAARTSSGTRTGRRARRATSLGTTARPLRLFSYIVARDFGFAPNPFHGWCTLATCKPEIRRHAAVGDWILGTGSKPRGRDGYAVYAMRVEEVLTFEEYWADPRFACKRPNLAGSRKVAFGDNIYRPDGDGGFEQLDSHHSFSSGATDPGNLAADTGGKRVLVSHDFIYWGGDGPRVPAGLRSFGPDHEDVCSKTQGHRCRFSDDLVAAAVRWMESFAERGLQGRPEDWPKT